MTKGLFIVIDGIDGAGKGTQIRLLSNWLKELNYDVLITHEPTKYVTGHLLRIALKLKEIHPLTDAFLFTADRVEHVENEIKPALKEGEIIISERYFYSTLAYQSAQGVSLEELKKINSIFPEPDLVIFIDVPAEVALQRKKEELYYKPEKFEKEIEFVKRVRNNFIKLAEENKYRLVDGSKNKEKVFQDIKKIVIEKLKDYELKN